MESLISKLLDEEEDGGPPLLVTAALHPVGHQILVLLLRCWDFLPCRHQLESALVTHLHQIKEDTIGCIVVKAQAGSL